MCKTILGFIHLQFMSKIQLYSIDISILPKHLVINLSTYGVVHWIHNLSRRSKRCHINFSLNRQYLYLANLCVTINE